MARLEGLKYVLSTSVERLEGSSVKLTVTVPSASVDEAIEDAYKNIAKKVRIPGFRPGRAPRPILDQTVGKQNILAEATEQLVNTTYPAALDAESLRPIEAPEMDELDAVEPGQEYTYSAEIEVRPELTLSSTDPIELTLPSAAPTDAEVQAQIDMLRERFATLEPVEDRALEPGDFALISFVGTVEGEPYEGNVVDKYLYETNHGLMPSEFDEGLVGAKAGEERHVEFAVPDTSSNPDFVGKTAEFDITVHEIKAKVLPEENDEFAENVGGFGSYEEMRENLQDRIRIQKQNSWEQLKERKAREALASRLEGDVPESMTKTRHQQIERDFESMLEQRQTSMEEYLLVNNIDFEQLNNDLSEQALLSVREELALEALFRAKGLELTDKDVEDEIRKIGGEDAYEETRKRWEDMGLMMVLREQIMHEKASAVMLEELVVHEEASESATAEGDAGTKKSAPKKRSTKKKKEEEAAATDTEE